MTIFCPGYSFRKQKEYICSLMNKYIRLVFTLAIVAISYNLAGDLSSKYRESAEGEGFVVLHSLAAPLQALSGRQAPFRENAEPGGIGNYSEQQAAPRHHNRVNWSKYFFKIKDISRKLTNAAGSQVKCRARLCDSPSHCIQLTGEYYVFALKHIII